VEGSLLSQGFELMLIGMGTVFSFLTLLVFATHGMSTLARRLQPDAPAAPGAALNQPPSHSQAGNDPAVVAAITAAIHQHRSVHPVPKDPK